MSDGKRVNLDLYFPHSLTRGVKQSGYKVFDHQRVESEGRERMRDMETNLMSMDVT